MTGADRAELEYVWVWIDRVETFSGVNVEEEDEENEVRRPEYALVREQNRCRSEYANCLKTLEVKLILNQGYDVVYLASTLGIKVIGLDASQTAIDKAIAYVSFIPKSNSQNLWLLQFYQRQATF